MNGFGFIEYDDALDARDVVPGKLPISILLVAALHDPCLRLCLQLSVCSSLTLPPEARRPLTTAYDEDGSDMNGSRLTVQFARGSRQRDFPAPDRTHPRPRRTAYRMQISGLPGETSWQVSSLLHYVCSWLLVRGSMDRALWGPSVSVAPLESPLVALSSFALLPFSLHPMRMTVASLD